MSCLTLSAPNTIHIKTCCLILLNFLYSFLANKLGEFNFFISDKSPLPKKKTCFVWIQYCNENFHTDKMAGLKELNFKSRTMQYSVN